MIDKNTIAVTLHVDWVQIYKKSSKSYGVIYLTNLNLPPKLAHAQENRILLSVSPFSSGHGESLNSILTLLVAELNECFQQPWIICDRPVRVVLMGVCADLPAMAKTCHHQGHGGSFPCFKCRFSPMIYQNYDLMNEAWREKLFDGRIVGAQGICPFCGDTEFSEISVQKAKEVINQFYGDGNNEKALAMIERLDQESGAAVECVGCSDDRKWQHVSCIVVAAEGRSRFEMASIFDALQKNQRFPCRQPRCQPSLTEDEFHCPLCENEFTYRMPVEVKRTLKEASPFGYFEMLRDRPKGKSKHPHQWLKCAGCPQGINWYHLGCVVCYWNTEDGVTDYDYGAHILNQLEWFCRGCVEWKANTAGRMEVEPSLNASNENKTAEKKRKNTEKGESVSGAGGKKAKKTAERKSDTGDHFDDNSAAADAVHENYKIDLLIEHVNQLAWIPRQASSHLSKLKQAKEEAPHYYKIAHSVMIGDKNLHPYAYDYVATAWSPLHDLAYFNPMRMCCVDLLHCFYLGIAKTLTQRMLFPLISSVHYDTKTQTVLYSIQTDEKKDSFLTDHLYPAAASIMDKIVKPQGIETISHKVRSRFGGMKGHDWLVWTNVYSELVLHELKAWARTKKEENINDDRKVQVWERRTEIFSDFIKIWIPFVKASCLLSSPVTLIEDVKESEKQLKLFMTHLLKSEFFKDRIAGYKGVNFHLMLHVPAQMLDWGCSSMFSNWQYERFNGEIAKSMTNHSQNENLQAMRSTLRTQNSSSAIKDVIKSQESNSLPCQSSKNDTSVRHEGDNFIYNCPGWTKEAVELLDELAYENDINSNDSQSRVQTIVEKDQICALLRRAKGSRSRLNFQAVHVPCVLSKPWLNFPSLTKSSDRSAAVVPESIQNGIQAAITSYYKGKRLLEEPSIKYFVQASILGDIYGSQFHTNRADANVEYRHKISEKNLKGRVIVYAEITSVRAAPPMDSKYDDRDSEAANENEVAASAPAPIKKKEIETFAIISNADKSKASAAAQRIERMHCIPVSDILCRLTLNSDGTKAVRVPSKSIV